MNSQQYSEIDDLLSRVPGNVIDFRVYKGANFAFLVKLATKHDRFAIGIDTFEGLGEPSPQDKSLHGQVFYPRGYAKVDIDPVFRTIKKVCGETNSFKINAATVDEYIQRKNTVDGTFAYAMVDLLHYHPTKLALDYLLNKIESGGMIHCLNYRQGYGSLSSLAIDDFLEAHGDLFHIIRPENSKETPFHYLKLIRKDKSHNTDSPKITQSVPTHNRVSLRPAKHTIAMVLRTGGDTYDYRYVNALAQNIKNNLTIKHNIVVLTNDDSGIDSNLVDDTVGFKHSYQGWWSKIELFRPDLFNSNQVFYVDLDTVITSNIDDMVGYNTVFAGIRDLYHHTYLQTGLMSWNPNYNHQVYENFITVAPNIMERYSLPSCGDARWIRENLYNYEYLPDIFPKRIVSYKAHCISKDTGKVGIPDGASFVCFHGKPRPHTIRNPIITEHWKYG